jgi:hypothetical protein
MAADGDTASLLTEAMGFLGTLVLNHLSFESFNELMFYAAKSTALLSSQFSPIDRKVLNGVIKDIIKNNCTATYRNVTKSCAIVNFVSFGLGVENPVSDYHYNLIEGACADTFTIPESNW